MQPAVRNLLATDIPAILQLWGTNVLDDLEILSYDRWGPGIAVPADEQVAEHRVVTDDPGDGLPKMLEWLVGAQDAFCLVAVDDQDRPFAYVVGRVTQQQVNDFSYGEITELYVREDQRRRGVGRDLVARAMTRLRDLGGLQFKVEVPKTWKEGNAFWLSQRYWEQDCVVYSLYD